MVRGIRALAVPQEDMGLISCPHMAAPLPAFVGTTHTPINMLAIKALVQRKINKSLKKKSQFLKLTQKYVIKFIHMVS